MYGVRIITVFLQEYHLLLLNIFILNIHRKISMRHLILQLCWTYMMSLLISRTCSALVSRQTIEYQQQLYLTSVLANFLFAYNLVMNDYLHYKPIILVLGEIYTYTVNVWPEIKNYSKSQKMLTFRK